MDSVNENWLPHLHPEVISEVEGNYLDAYVVALEGWRRGLTLRWHVKDSEKFKEMKTWYVDRPGQLFSLHSKEKSHYFFRTRGDKVTNDAVRKGMDKEVTKNILKEAGVSVPEGRQFTNFDSDEVIIDYAKTLGFPVVLKPTDGSFGRGVFSDIKTEEELKHSLQYVREQLEEDRIIVEKYIPGKDYRLYVVGDEVVGAILRVPPNVIGDGINSIEALIDIKNAERQLNPRLTSCPIKTNRETIEFIGKSGYTLQTVPEKDEVVYLNDKGNISIGGDPIDVLDELSEEMKQLAVQALQAIPGLTHGAVDLIIGQDEDGNEFGYVIELNPTAQIGGILFPAEGKSRDIPKAIIDYYFPETKDVNLINAYFNMNKVLEPLTKNLATTSSVIDIWKSDYRNVLFIVKGKVHSLDFHRLLRNEALKTGLIGSIKIIEENELSVIVAGSVHIIKEYKEFIANQDLVEFIVEKEWNMLVSTGVEIENANQNLLNDIRMQQKRITQLRDEHQKAKKKYYDMLNSTSWKITLPIRRVTGFFKDKIKS